MDISFWYPAHTAVCTAVKQSSDTFMSYILLKHDSNCQKDNDQAFE